MAQVSTWIGDYLWADIPSLHEARQLG